MEQKHSKKHRNKKKALNNYSRYSGIAFQMFAIIGIGVFSGIKIDAYFQLSFPVFTLVLSLGSVVLAIYFAIKDFLKE